MGTLTGDTVQSFGSVQLAGRYVLVEIRGQGIRSLAEVQVYGELQTAGAFVPDPNKIYHIDNPAHGLRLAATGNSEMLESRTFALTAVNTQWRFV